jgi:copper chaperone CopZ
MIRTYQVRSIHCQGCQATIRAALVALPGVLDVDPDQRTNQVRVRFDETALDPEQIPARLAAAGFPVRALVTEPTSSTRQHTPRPPRSGRGRARYGLLAAVVAAVAVIGYLGYLLYPRFDLPAVQGAGLLVLAAAAGVASFFSPCSFPLLVTLLGRQVDHRRGVRPARFGGALALGAAAFLLLAGVVIALSGQALFAGVTFTSPTGITIRAFVGVVLILLGLVQAGVLRGSLDVVERLVQPLRRTEASLRRRHPVAGFAVFGFGYVLAGFG